MKIKKYYIAIILITVFLSVFMINFWTPVHSDDFLFSNMTIKEFSLRYLNWSGRIVADFLGQQIMNIKQPFLAFVQSLAFIFLVYLISQIPYKINGKKFNLSNFIAIFLIYWIYHPDLGQSTFWVVGSANYLWTNIFLLSYLFFLLYYLLNHKFNLLLFPLALISGLLNENTSIFTAPLTILVLLYIRYNKKVFDIKILCLSILNLIGTLFFILAPGNQVRLTRFAEWKNTSILRKLYNYFNTIYGNYMSHFSIAIIITIVIFILIYIYKCSFPKQSKKINLIIYFSIISFIVSMLSILSLVASPPTAVRALSGPFIFLLLSISFGFYILNTSYIVYKNLQKIFIVFLTIVFIYTYIHSFIPLYYSYHKQNKIIDSIIKKADKNSILDIPAYYDSIDNASRIDIDEYIDEHGMAQYFGVKGIHVYDLGFDFSKIDKKYQIPINYEQSLFKSLYVYSRGILSTVFIFEIDEATLSKLDSKKHIFLHLNPDNNRFSNQDIGEIKNLKRLDNKMYIVKYTNKNILLTKEIQFGVFDIDSGLRIEDHKVFLKKD